MATQDLTSLKLRLVYDDGVDEAGKPVFAYKTYNNINLASTPDEILAAAQQLASLCSKPLFTVEKNESYDIHA